MASRLVSELQFGSYFVYSPRGTSDVSRRSRRVRSAVKSGDVQTIRTMVEHVATNLESSGLAAVLGGDVTLVPCPRSSPLVDGALWPGRIIAEELVRVGLGREVSALLWRTEAVPKSAFAVAGKRPDAVRHYETIEAVVDLAVSGIGSEEDIRSAAEKCSGLGLFVRSLVGLDRQAAKEALAGFLAGKTLTANQIEFVNLIVDHLTEHGVMKPERFYESPFIEWAPRGPEELFTQGELDELLGAVEEVRRTAVGA